MSLVQTNNSQPPTRFSGVVLVLANLIPLVGVFLWNWSIFEIVIIYWSENLIIGVIHLIKLAVLQTPTEVNGQKEFEFNVAGKIFTLPFFLFHYGLFCTVHGVFVFVLLGKKSGADPMDVLKMLTIGPLAIAFWILVASHAFSFFTNFIGQGRYKMGEDGAKFSDPYGRIMTLHVAIVLGAFATMALGSPIILLIILIIGKSVLDLKFHIKANKSKRLKS